MILISYACQIRVPEDPARNRQNQQRCRARRKEYVEELERRLREYERRDATATVEMQRIAQAATWKNERLLLLLALHGVSQTEIDTFLQREAGAAGDSSSNYGIPPLVKRSESSRTVLTSIGIDRLEPLRPRSDVAAPEPLSVNHISTQPSMGTNTVTTADSYNMGSNEVQVNADLPYTANSISSENLPGHYRNEEDAKEVCHPGDAATPTTEDGTSEISTEHATSCDAAANIIAGLQGHGDATQARGLLGCKDSTTCHVKNTRLFQLMVETT